MGKENKLGKRKKKEKGSGDNDNFLSPQAEA